MVEIRRGGGRRGEGEGEGGRGEGEETDIKSNNPHLTGGEITRDIFRATHKGSGGHCSGPNPHLTQGLFNASQRMPESHRENTQIPKAIMFGYAFHDKQIHLLRF